MRVHHLNCMTFHLGVQSITHCLLIETENGLILVDSGLGTGDYINPTLFVRAFTTLNRVPCDLEETAVRQVVKLGFSPEDVQNIVLTHLHIDHAGGLPDFPWANVHVYALEYEAAMNPRRFSLFERFYITAHWAHQPKWVIHTLEEELWFGLECVQVQGGESEIMLIPLAGHSQGHCGVAVKTPEGWLLHCGDAFVRDTQVDPYHPRSPFPSWAEQLERMLFPASAISRLRVLLSKHGDEVQLFCSHDPHAFLRLKGGG